MGRKRCRDRSRTKRSRLVYISIWGIMLMLHVIAWSSKWFCDWYLTYIYGIWVDTYGRAMGRIPFCVGEILIGLGIGFGAVGILLGMGWLFGKAKERHRKARSHTQTEPTESLGRYTWRESRSHREFFGSAPFRRFALGYAKAFSGQF